MMKSPFYKGGKNPQSGVTDKVVKSVNDKKVFGKHSVNNPIKK